MRHRRAFDKPRIETARYFPDLVFEAIDHWLELDGLSFLAGTIPLQPVIFIPGGRDPDHTFRACDLRSEGRLAG